LAFPSRVGVGDSRRNLFDPLRIRILGAARQATFINWRLAQAERDQRRIFTGRTRRRSHGPRVSA